MRWIGLLLVCVSAHAGSLKFAANEPRKYDFADQAVLPPAFGAGEFTFEIWIKPDHTFPVGDTDRGTIGQLTNWTDADRAPYSSPGWWHAGNWLLDGHSRPNGYGGSDSRAGTFSLQLFGGGRVRWTFADDDRVVPIGMVWAVQPAPARNAPTLLDGKWHRITCIRRYTGESGADLELWIDGALVAKTNIPQRVNMRRFWDSLPHPNDPKELGGWSWGSEVMTSWGMYFTQYEDYKGLLDEMKFYDRALTPGEIAAGSDRGLVGHFPFDEKSTADRLDRKRTITLHGVAWSEENAPSRR